ncbi:MAG: hypothetical protein V3W18_12245 [candidate division Zixibacteria bacterium]
MRFLNLGKAISLSVVIVLAILFFATNSHAQQVIPISGKINATYTQQDSTVVSAADGHVMFISVSEGTNVSLEGGFMDGAQATNMGFSDLTKGSGPHEGYIQFVKGDDGTMGQWQGKVTTVMSPEGTPVTTFEGNYRYIRGNGKFEGIKGSGTYRGTFTSKTEYTVEWQGDYILGK